jgi:phospholipid/cholesterol/gamma-HCH transport system permease protein
MREPGSSTLDSRLSTQNPRLSTAFIAHVGRRSLEAGRALADVRTWLPLLAVQMRRLGVDSVPIAVFIAVFTGIVLSLLSSYIFTGTVPLYFVGALVGKTIMMELGPVLTGMALAGRVGASIAAELGTMKVTEQVDALETLAYDRYAYLVVPRVLAATLMFPMVTAFAMAVGVASGWITAINLLDLSTPEFSKGLRLFYQFKDIWFGLVKSASFGGAGWPRKAGQKEWANPPPAPSCSAARQSWCWTPSGPWSSCDSSS